MWVFQAQTFCIVKLLHIVQMHSYSVLCRFNIVSVYVHCTTLGLFRNSKILSIFVSYFYRIRFNDFSVNKNITLFQAVSALSFFFFE